MELGCCVAVQGGFCQTPHHTLLPPHTVWNTILRLAPGFLEHSGLYPGVFLLAVSLHLRIPTHLSAVGTIAHQAGHRGQLLTLNSSVTQSRCCTKGRIWWDPFEMYLLIPENIEPLKLLTKHPQKSLPLSLERGGRSSLVTLDHVPSRRSHGTAA